MGFDILEQFVALGVDKVNKFLEFHKLFWTMCEKNI